jgi:Domain of unknown function (DUF4173)
MSEPTPEFWNPAQAAEDLESTGSGRMFAPAPPPAPVLRPPGATLPLLLTLGLALLTYLMTRGTGGNLGLNAPLLVLVLLGSLGLASRLRRSQVQTPALVLLALGTLCAVGLTLNTGSLITILNASGLLLSLALGLAYLRFPGLTHLSAGQVLLAAFWSWLRGVYGLPLLAFRFPWARVVQARRLSARFQGEQTRRVLIGLLFTVPLLLLFGALLGQSDARFGDLIARLFSPRLPDWNPNELMFSLMQLGFWAFLLGGPVYAVLLATRPAPQIQTVTQPRLTLTELGIPLISVSVLFCAYLLVQAQTLFHPGLAAGLTYSESVRRGFGELTAVAALTLVVLLIAHTLLRRELRTTLAYRLTSAAVLLPLGLLIASAYHRLELYVQAYGLSEIRVLGGVFLAWVVLSLLAYTVLLWRGGLERFAYFSLISGLGLIAGMNVVSPGRLIATVNLSRVTDAGQNAGGWAAGGVGRMHRAPAPTLIETAKLGPDALPTLLGHLDATGGVTGALKDKGFGPTLTCELARQNDPSNADTRDWRIWNLARSRAAQLIQQLELANPQLAWVDCRVASGD